MFVAPRQIRSAVVGGGDFPVGLAPLSEIDLRRIWSALRRGWATILFSALAGLVLAVLFIAIAPREYTAVTQILIDPTDLRAVGNDTNPSTQISDAAVMQVESQVSVLTSDAVLRHVVDAEDLAHDPEFVRGPSLLNTLMGKGANPGGDTLSALNELKRRVQVKRAERTYVVEVDVTSKDAMKAVRIANAIAQAYLNEQTQVRADAARQVSQTLSARLKDLKDSVREAEEKVEAFKARNNIVNANGQLIGDQQLAEMNNQVGAAQARTAEAKARLDQVEQVQRTRDESGAFPEALQSPTITALRSQYAEIRRREAEQMATLGARHPAVIDIEAQAERLRHMIDDEIDRTAVAARTEYQSAKASEQTLTDNFDALKHTSINTNEALVGLRELERDAQASRSVYEAFLVRARETGEQEQLDTKNIRVLSKADLPQKRSSPPPSMLVALGAMMLGAAVGTGLVLVRPVTDDAARVRIGGPTLRRRLATIGFWPAAAPDVPVLAILPDADVSFALSAVDDPASPFAREIRKVYDEIRASHVAPGNASILIIAADTEDDSATVALGLATVAAATERVLLIDADLERRTLAAIDADDGEAGLVDVAVGRRLLSDVTRLDRQTNVNVVPFISPESRRDRRIYDGDLRRAFEQTKRYDLVIVAAMSNGDPNLNPSLDPAVNPSLGFFAGLVDHIVLVVRAEEYETAASRQIIARLGLEARKVRGAVLTGATPA